MDPRNRRLDHAGGGRPGCGGPDPEGHRVIADALLPVLWTLPDTGSTLGPQLDADPDGGSLLRRLPAGSGPSSCRSPGRASPSLDH